MGALKPAFLAYSVTIYGIVKTTRLAGGLLCPYKGLFPACARKAH